MKMFKVLNEGIFATFQDMGRFGYEDKGITNSGASDELSYILSNKLLKNPLNSTSIELTLGKLKLQALSNTRVSIGGADTRAKLNGKILKNWSCFPVKKDDILEFGYAIDGQITYISVQGGFKTKKFFDSSSVNTKEGIGSVIKKNDFLQASISANRQKSCYNQKFVPKMKIKKLTLRFVSSYQVELFDKELFLNANFKISNKYNKMGYQLNSDKIIPKSEHLISEAIAFGAIQITNKGNPIILLKNRQTIGGYPKIGTVLPIDCFKLSQCGANTIIKFEEIDMPKARNLIKDFYNKLKYLV